MSNSPMQGATAHSQTAGSNMKMKFTVFTYHILILFACHVATEKEQPEIKTKITPEDIIKASEIANPVDVQKVKNLDWVKTTSGIASNTENLKLCNWKEKGFFGFYFLIDRKRGPVGKLTVYAKDDINGWRFDNQTDEFARIELQTNRIKIWDEIRVGLTKSQLLGFLEPYDIEASDSIVRSRLGNYSTEFVILGDTVNRLMIERNCKEKKLEPTIVY